ncbi:MAG: helicase [Gammaproteobacteria bacterium]|nr:helicase [Gammaproteobacteria bacterium]
MNDSGLHEGQISLFDQEVDFLAELSARDGWPDPNDFPYNARKSNVGSVVIKDLKASANPLIVTGYASLEKIIGFCSEIDNDGSTIRILLGSEPYETKRTEFRLNSISFPEEIREYWLERSISILLSAQLIQMIENLKSGRIQTRFIDAIRNRLHAKIYVGDNAVTIGSSNFSANGLQHQLEANVRFIPRDKKRYTSARSLAFNYWKMGVDYNDQLIRLLEQLLRVVSWQEALARACAEVLEGDWAKRYLEIQMLPGDLPLWPSQKQGIAQALWLLETVGSVLVADATGAGKTRMGAYLVRAAVDRIWSTGRVRKGRPFLLCPPSVIDVWDRESRACQLPLDVASQGGLSRSQTERGADMAESVRRAQILAVDEAHNFHNPKSQRTQMLLGNIADHVILFTATPINKGPLDLLRLADMLGADNLDDETIEMFEKILRKKFLTSQGLSDKEIKQLRRQIQQFTVRRTKAMLNELVDRDPQAYRSKSGDLCRYPEHHSLTYELGEDEQDRRIASQISDIADTLRGVSYLKRKIELPAALAKEGWDEKKYLESRLLSASRLARYVVMSCLRSSRAALIEHIEGTEVAIKFEDLPEGAKKNSTGDQVGKLIDLKGKPPGHSLNVDVPEWLTDADMHAQVCNEEVVRYRDIAGLVRKLSPGREKAKGKHLAKLAADHALSIAFDSKPISLAVTKKFLLTESPDIEAVIATGENKTEREKIRRLFDHSSKASGIVALCSDSMSEGVNLQQASVVTHLDMPSVVRIAEQRVGRVDRMDSPHKKIQAWWPEDAEEFALSTDDRFVERLETVDVLIGSNMPLPESIRSGKMQRVSAQEAIKEQEELEKDKNSWDELHDALQPVRELVEGENLLIEDSVYEQYRQEKARILSRVSLVPATSPWAFFCVAGSLIGAPRWVFFSGDMERPLIDLNDITKALREVLNDEVGSTKMDAKATEQLDKYLNRLLDSERDLLPRRKRRALKEMTEILNVYREEAGSAQNQSAFDFFSKLLNVLEMKERRYVPDWAAIADRWLDIVRPVWYERLTDRRKRPLLLKDIRADLVGDKKLGFNQIVDQFSSLPSAIPADKRVVAVILGVPK